MLEDVPACHPDDVVLANMVHEEHARKLFTALYE
jgi:hypothetical protein